LQDEARMAQDIDRHSKTKLVALADEERDAT
jgi:hypothetical protein